MKRPIPPAKMKPLFLALKAIYYDAFLAGTKDTKYRLAGRGGWNAKTCVIGRRITLSRGYGKQQRMKRIIRGFEERYRDAPDFIACYGKPGMAACIYIPKPKEN